MKKYVLLICAIFALMACNERNTPSQGGNSSQNGTIDFSYQLVEPPFTYSFTNKSKGATDFKWDFGDGSYSYAKDAMYSYESMGTYTVTLSGTINGIKYDCQKKVVVKKPSVYVAGYTLYKIPYNNKYYKVECKDDDWFSTNWGFTTIYTPLLNSSDMPYVKYFSNPLIMDKLDGDNYYTFYVYYTSNTSTTSGDTQCLKQKLQKSQILEYNQENILTSDNGQTKIGILMKYQ